MSSGLQVAADKRELVEAIGLVAIAGGRCEWSVRYLFTSLVANPGGLEPELVAAGQGVSWLTDYVKSLASHHQEFSTGVLTDEQIDAANAIADDIKAAWRQRNGVVHELWDFESDSTVASRLRRLPGEPTPRSAEGIRSIAGTLIALAHRAMLLADSIVDSARGRSSNDATQ